MVDLLRCIAARLPARVPPGKQTTWDSTRPVDAFLRQEWQGVLQRHGEDQWPQADTASSLSLSAYLSSPVIECVGFRRAVQRAPASSPSRVLWRGCRLAPCGNCAATPFDRDWFDMSHSLCLTLLARRHPDVVKDTSMELVETISSVRWFASSLNGRHSQLSARWVRTVAVLREHLVAAVSRPGSEAACSPSLSRKHV